MFCSVKYSGSVTPHQLDDYLAEGWYRMHQSIFTANFLYYNNDFFSVIWLRNNLSQFNPGTTGKKLAKLNSRFTVQVQPFKTITPQHIQLFKQYAGSKPPGWPSDLVYLLMGSGNTHNMFNTHVLNLYDGPLLIGACVFDVGVQTAAGITSFYHPQYTRHSLGKYLIYLVVQHCCTLGLQYFYPGYFAPGIKEFDYKLSIGSNCLQYYSYTAQQWLPMHTFTPDCIMLNVMVTKLQQLQQTLQTMQVPTTLLYYAYFNLAEQYEVPGGLWDYPVFLCLQTVDSAAYHYAVVYNPANGNYHLHAFNKAGTDDAFILLHNRPVCATMLTVSPVLLSHPTAETFAQALVQL
jgi:arginyl-tRNA--protein-N-Asp/Glu arginylyltransferase